MEYQLGDFFYLKWRKDEQRSFWWSFSARSFGTVFESNDWQLLLDLCIFSKLFCDVKRQSVFVLVFLDFEAFLEWLEFLPQVHPNKLFILDINHIYGLFLVQILTWLSFLDYGHYIGRYLLPSMLRSHYQVTETLSFPFIRLPIFVGLEVPEFFHGQAWVFQLLWVY